MNFIFRPLSVLYSLFMELSKLANEMENFIKLVNAKREDIFEINDHLSAEVDSIIDELKKFASANQCTLPARVVNEFPDVKRRVVVNIVSLINGKMKTIEGISAKLYDYIKEMRKLQDRISRLTYEINWSQHTSYYTAFNRILEWTEECWKTLYFLYVNISNGMKFLACDQSHSAMHLKPVREIKQYDRAILLMTSEMSHLVTMLKADLSSRSQTVDAFS